MPISRNQKTLLHVAKSKLRLSDETYRMALARVAGVASSSELDADGFAAMMGLFEHMGFRPLDRRGPAYGERPGMASFAQLPIIVVSTRDRPEDRLRGLKVGADAYLTKQSLDAGELVDLVRRLSGSGR